MELNLSSDIVTRESAQYVSDVDDVVNLVVFSPHRMRSSVGRRYSLPFP